MNNNIINKPVIPPKNSFNARLRNSEVFKYIKYKYLVFMFLPVIAYYILFHYFPIYGVQIAFKDFKLLGGIWGSPWVGFENFITLFQMRSFREVLGNTIIISSYKLIFGFPAPIIFALLLNEINKLYFKKAVQTITYLPHFLSWVILGGIFIQFLSPSVGPINIFLKAIGVQPVFFLGDTQWYRFTLVITAMWKDIGWGSIIYIATLSSVNPEMYEAAIIDGAGRFKRVVYVSLPSLLPVISIMLIFAIGGLINDDFDQIFNTYNPSVYKVGDVLSTYIYRRGLESMEYSFATAVGLFKNIVAFAMIIISNVITKKISENGIW